MKRLKNVFQNLPTYRRVLEFANWNIRLHTILSMNVRRRIVVSFRFSTLVKRGIATAVPGKQIYD